MVSSWWVASFWNNPQFGPAFVVAWAFWVILAITLHELSHGWAAIRLGDRTPIEQGRMVFNPLVHMGPMSLLMFAIIGIAWGAMPVNPSRLRGRHAQAKVALAGPAMNLILAAASLVLFTLWLGFGEGRWVGGLGLSDHAAGNMRTLFHLGIALNLLLFFFNMLPVMPLDGGRILGDLVPSYRRMFEGERGPMLMMGMIVLLVLFAGRVIFPAAFEATSWLERTVFEALGLYRRSAGG